MMRWGGGWEDGSERVEMRCLERPRRRRGGGAEVVFAEYGVLIVVSESKHQCRWLGAGRPAGPWPSAALLRARRGAPWSPEVRATGPGARPLAGLARAGRGLGAAVLGVGVRGGEVRGAGVLKGPRRGRGALRQVCLTRRLRGRGAKMVCWRVFANSGKGGAVACAAGAPGVGFRGGVGRAC
jgi:hypothetical protein